MNILMDIAHPAHLHLLRNTYFQLKENGHNLFVTVKDIPAAIELLKKYNIPYIYLGGKKDSLLGKAILQLNYNFKIWKLVISKRIDIGFCSSMTIAHISKISKMKSIILDDDDDDVEPLFVKYAHPYVDVILSPQGTQRKSKRTIFYNGYHELAYLHPNRFTPDENVLSEIGVKKGEIYFVLRFNAFKAHHDVGVQGLSIEDKRKLIALLQTKGKVFITTERNIDDEFKKYQLLLPPEKVHSLIYYAAMFIGDSQTMTSEAAVLGTPAIRCNTFVGKITYLKEEEEKYDLTYGFLPTESKKMFDKINKLLQLINTKDTWQEKREKLLNDKIDVTAFYVWFIENYPESEKIMKERPNYQYKFK